MSPFADYLTRIFATPPILRFDPVENTDAWAEKVRQLVRRRLEFSPSDEAFRATIDDGRIGGILARRVTFETSGGRRFAATLLVPGPAKPAAIIMVLPGENARHEQVIGAEEPDFPEHNVAQQLAQAGFATLTIDYGMHDAIDQAKIKGRDETSLLAQALALRSVSLLGYLTSNALTALRWLEDEIDRTGCIGILGHSLGGHIALHGALAHDTRLPVVLASCASTYRAMIEKSLIGGGYSLPGMLRYVDLPDLIAALVPASVHIQHGVEDRVCPYEDAKRAIETAEECYRRLNAAEKFETAALPMGHATDAAKAASFFERAFASAGRQKRRNIPPVRILFGAAARATALDHIDQALFTGALTLGPVGVEFERKVAGWTGTPDAVAVASGTAAIEVALRVVDVKGRCVVLPANTFFATASAALAAGADIDFVDTEPDGLGIDPNRLLEKLKVSNVAAVIAVHIGGIVSPRLQEIAAMCDAYGVALVEDAAHALGSDLDGKPAGSFGRLGAFSFFPTKVITSAEGGMVSMHAAEDAMVARRLRDHGKISFNANVHDRIGSSWRMSEVHAAIGVAHIAKLPEWLEERRAAAAYYDARLAELESVQAVIPPADSHSNFYKYIALLDQEFDRATVKSALRDRHGVFLPGEVYDTLCCLQPALQGRFRAENFPVAFDFSRRHICLPIFPGLNSAQQDMVIEALRTELKAAQSRHGD